MALDRAKLTAIGHADHVLCNPVSPGKVDEILDLLEIPDGGTILDAGCGKAELLIRLIERRASRGRGATTARGGGRAKAEPHTRAGAAGGAPPMAVLGIGVDRNARFLAEARKSAAARVADGAIVLIEADVATWLKDERSGVAASRPARGAHLRQDAHLAQDRPGPGSARSAAAQGSRTARRAPPGSRRPSQSAAKVAMVASTGAPAPASARASAPAPAPASAPQPFDAAICTGSTHAFGGYRQTLRALRRVVRSGGQLLVGEGYWRKDPEPGYLQALGATRAEFHDHAGNVAVAVEEGLVPLYSTVSTGDEWDRYEGLYLRAVERYVEAHPEDPDTPELRDHIRRWRDAYLRWGRDTLGFGMYLFRV